MKKLTMTLTATALLWGSTMLSADAQTQQLGAGLHAQIRNATPIVEQAACRGFGPYCPPGFTRVCGPFRCWCRRCY